MMQADMLAPVPRRFWAAALKVGLCCCVIGSSACRPPRIAPLLGVTPEGAVLPSFELPAGHRQAAFTWELDENSMLGRGDGVARFASPDSARVDLFLAGGFGSASAILIGDSTHVPPRSQMVSMIPPPPLLWAALGRLALPPFSDTVIKVSGDTLRADIGNPVAWRVLAVGSELRRVERIESGRVVEFVTRVLGEGENASSIRRVRYELANRRSLVLIVQNETHAEFDASIWKY